jgi:hypothetical protein
VSITDIVGVVAQIGNRQREIGDADDLPILDIGFVERVDGDGDFLSAFFDTLRGDDDFVDEWPVLRQRNAGSPNKQSTNSDYAGPAPSLMVPHGFIAYRYLNDQCVLVVSHRDLTPNCSGCNVTYLGRNRILDWLMESFVFPYLYKSNTYAGSSSQER